MGTLKLEGYIFQRQLFRNRNWVFPLLRKSLQHWVARKKVRWVFKAGMGFRNRCFLNPFLRESFSCSRINRSLPLGVHFPHFWGHHQKGTGFGLLLPPFRADLSGLFPNLGFLHNFWARWVYISPVVGLETYGSAHFSLLELGVLHSLALLTNFWSSLPLWFLHPL